MSVKELDSFVKKFYQLRSYGYSAHLDLETHSGKAWVGLRVQLGHLPPGYLHHPLCPPYPQPHYRKPDSPSCQRRRDRRAAAHKSEAEEASKKEYAEEVDPTVIVEKAVHEDNFIDETRHQASESDQNDETLVGAAEEAYVKDMKVSDEVCPDEQYDEVDDSESESQKVQIREVFSFKSDIPEDDIKKQLDEVLKKTNVTSVKIIMKDQLRPESAEHLYTLELKIDKENKKNASFSWPQMSSSQKENFQNLKRIF